MNKVFMVMLRLGVPISRREPAVVLTVPGRKTGKPRSTPVTPMDVDGERYVVNGYPGADWVRQRPRRRRGHVDQGQAHRAGADGRAAAGGGPAGAAGLPGVRCRPASTS